MLVGGVEMLRDGGGRWVMVRDGGGAYVIAREPQRLKLRCTFFVSEFTTLGENSRVRGLGLGLGEGTA